MGSMRRGWREMNTSMVKLANSQTPINRREYPMSFRSFGACSLTSSARSKMADMGFSTARMSPFCTMNRRRIAYIKG